MGEPCGAVSCEAPALLRENNQEAPTDLGAPRQAGDLVVFGDPGLQLLEDRIIGQGGGPLGRRRRAVVFHAVLGHCCQEPMQVIFVLCLCNDHPSFAEGKDELRSNSSSPVARSR